VAPYIVVIGVEEPKNVLRDNLVASDDRLDDVVVPNDRTNRSFVAPNPTKIDANAAAIGAASNAQENDPNVRRRRRRRRRTPPDDNDVAVRTPADFMNAVVAVVSSCFLLAVGGK